MRRDGVWNKAERGPPRRKNLETDHLRLEALQLIEIPQNHQSFLWKSLEGNTLFLERLGKKLGGPPRFRRLHYRDPAHGCEPGISAQNSRARRIFSVCKMMVLPDRIELSTSPLPMECSTTELRQRFASGASSYPATARSFCHSGAANATMASSRADTQQVVEIDDADDFAGLDHQQRLDLATDDFEGLGRERLRCDRPRRAGHHLLDRRIHQEV